MIRLPNCSVKNRNNGLSSKKASLCDCKSQPFSNGLYCNWCHWKGLLLFFPNNDLARLWMDGLIQKTCPKMGHRRDDHFSIVKKNDINVINENNENNGCWKR